MATDADVTVDDGIAWLTMRKPDTRNAVKPDFMEAAIAALDAVPDGIGALVLAGEGPAFCVGVNLDMTQRLLGDGQGDELHRRIIADELLALGLADEVAHDGEVRAAAQRLAAEVAGAAPAALLAT